MRPTRWALASTSKEAAAPSPWQRRPGSVRSLTMWLPSLVDVEWPGGSWKPQGETSRGAKRDEEHTSLAAFLPLLLPWSQRGSVPRAMGSCLHVCLRLQPTCFFRLGFWAGTGNTGGLICLTFLTCRAPGWGGHLPFRKLPPFCLYIEITCQAIPSLGSPRLPLFGVSVITQHFIPRVLLLKGKLQKGGSFSVPLTCYRVCPEACLAEGKLSKILLGERDGRPGQASIGNGSETGTLLGLGFACLPLSMMQLAPPACCLHALCAPPSFNNGDSIIGPPPAMAGTGFSSPNNNPT